MEWTIPAFAFPADAGPELHSLLSLVTSVLFDKRLHKLRAFWLFLLPVLPRFASYDSLKRKNIEPALAKEYIGLKLIYTESRICRSLH